MELRYAIGSRHSTEIKWQKSSFIYIYVDSKPSENSFLILIYWSQQ